MDPWSDDPALLELLVYNLSLTLGRIIDGREYIIFALFFGFFSLVAGKKLPFLNERRSRTRPSLAVPTATRAKGVLDEVESTDNLESKEMTVWYTINKSFSSFESSYLNESFFVYLRYMISINSELEDLREATTLEY